MADQRRREDRVAGRRTPAITGRLVVLVAALIACAWFLLGIRQAQDQARVNALLSSHSKITASQARAANASLDEAQFLNPDQSVAAARAAVEFRAGNRGRAVALAESVTRREPQGVDGWLLLSELVVTSDPPLFHLAQARISALAPPVPTR